MTNLNFTKSYTLKKLESDINKINKDLEKFEKSIKNHDVELKDKQQKVAKLKSELEQLLQLQKCL
jgi:septal ring factor EnvC (AmiA/AmiB activator)